MAFWCGNGKTGTTARFAALLRLPPGGLLWCVDSVFLAYVTREVLGGHSLAVITDSPSLPRRELEEALAVASQFGFPVRVVRTSEFEIPSYLANPCHVKGGNVFARPHFWG